MTAGPSPWCRPHGGPRAALGETACALTAGIRSVSRLVGISWWQRFLVACLKIVAILGYHSGKWRSTSCKAASDGAKERASRQDIDAVVAAGLARAAAGHYQIPANHHTLGGRPLLAVVIPVYAKTEAHLVLLLAALECVSRQTRQPDYLVLVDDGSPLPIPSIISGVRVLVLRLEHNSGPAVARNAGLQTARSLGCQLVAFLDADCLPEANWLGVMERAQRRKPGIVTGRTMASAPNTPVGLYHDVCGTLNGRSLPDGSMLYGCTCNLSVDLRSVPHQFDATFPEAAFEDVEYCVRARKAGIPVTYDPDAIVRHRYDHTWMGLFRQFARYGRFEALMCERHSEYREWLWKSHDVSSLSSIGLALKPARHAPPSDSVLCEAADAQERKAYEARGPLLSSNGF